MSEDNATVKRKMIPADDAVEAMTGCEGNMKAMARKLVEQFKAEQKRLGGGKPKEEWTRLGCRLINRNASVYIEWYVQFWGKANKQGSKVFSKYLKKEKGSYKYNINVLKKYAATWDN